MYLYSDYLAGLLCANCATTQELSDSECHWERDQLFLLTGHPESFDTEKQVTPQALKNWLSENNAAGLATEAAMNYFWELDNKPVEKILFWEEAGVDLAQMKE